MSSQSDLDDDEAFVRGMLQLNLKGPSTMCYAQSSKYGSLTSPTGDVEDTTYIRGFRRTHVHPTARTSEREADEGGLPSTRSKQSAVALLQSMKRNRGRFHHHPHAVAAQREHQRTTEAAGPALAPLVSAQSSEAGSVAAPSVASFGTSLSHASTRVVKEPLRPSWMPLRASKSMGNRRVQGAGLLHVSGRIAKEQVSASLRDTYQEQQHPSLSSRRSASVGRVDGHSGYPKERERSTARSTARAAEGAGGAGRAGAAVTADTDGAKGLRRVFKLQLHTLPAIEGVKGLEERFETAVLFRKPSTLTETERRAIFSSLVRLRQDAAGRATATAGIEAPASSTSTSTFTSHASSKAPPKTAPIGEEIQSRLDRLSLLRDRAAGLLHRSSTAGTR